MHSHPEPLPPPMIPTLACALTKTGCGAKSRLFTITQCFRNPFRSDGLELPAGGVPVLIMVPPMLQNFPKKVAR